MARISGVDIPREKRLEIALTYIYGIGRATSAKMCKELELSPDTRVRNLTDSEVNKIRMYIENGLTVEGDLRRNVQTDIKRKIEIGSYQGTRHRKGLPVRGQRTHINNAVPATSEGITSNARGINGSSNTTSGALPAAPKNAEPLPCPNINVSPEPCNTAIAMAK